MADGKRKPSEGRLAGYPRIEAAERVLDAIDNLVYELNDEDDGNPHSLAGVRLAAMQAGANAARWAVASIVWARHGSHERARAVEERGLAAYHAIAGGVSDKEKLHAIVEALEFAARVPRDRAVMFFVDRMQPLLTQAQLERITPADVLIAVEAAGRKPGRSKGVKNGERRKSKPEVLTDFLRKLDPDLAPASAEALEKALEKVPTFPRLVE